MKNPSFIKIESSCYNDINICASDIVIIYSFFN